MIADLKKPIKPVSPHAPQPAQQMQPQAPAQQQLTITIPSINIVIDKEFKAKVPFLFLLLLLFSFALVMFERSNFSTMDLVDFQRFEYHLQKTYSISFIIFVVLFSAALGIAIFFGARISRLLSLLVLPITLVPALVMGSFYPALMAPYLAFALTLSAGALIASFYREPSFSNVWGTASKALLVLLVLSFFIVFDKVSATKDAHMDAFFASASGMLPSSGGGDLSAAIRALPISKQTIADAVTEDTLKQAISKEDMQTLVAVAGGTSEVSDVGYEAAIKQLRTSIVDKGDVLAAGVKTSLATQFSTPSGVSPSAAMLKAQMYSTPAFKPFYDNYAKLIALVAVSLVAVMNFFIQLFAAAIAVLLAKL